MHHGASILSASIVLVGGLVAAWGLQQCSNSYLRAHEVATRGAVSAAQLAEGRQILADEQRLRMHQEQMQMERDRMSQIKTMWTEEQEARIESEQRRLNTRMLETQADLMQDALHHHLDTSY